MIEYSHHHITTDLREQYENLTIYRNRCHNNYSRTITSNFSDELLYIVPKCTEAVYNELKRNGHSGTFLFCYQYPNGRIEYDAIKDAENVRLYYCTDVMRENI